MWPRMLKNGPILCILHYLLLSLAAALVKHSK